MAKKKILCIDDTPEAPEIDGKTLKDTLKNIYDSSHYQVIFETDGERGIETVKNDHDIKLILLDVEFKRQKKQGDRIADELLNVNTGIKIIVLTRKDIRGKKISFGSKDNVVHYVLKKELSNQRIQKCLKNLTIAVIEDYYNKTWQLEYREGSGGDVLCLRNTNRLEDYPINTFTINISDEYLPAIRECIQNPNEPVDISCRVAGKKQNRILNLVNSQVRNITDWNIWGILTREGCARAHIRLLIGTVILARPTFEGDIPYVTRREFNNFRDEINSKLDELKNRLESK